jgi:hypothetical protein
VEGLRDGASESSRPANRDDDANSSVSEDAAVCPTCQRGRRLRAGSLLTQLRKDAAPAHRASLAVQALWVAVSNMTAADTNSNSLPVVADECSMFKLEGLSAEG